MVRVRFHSEREWYVKFYRMSIELFFITCRYCNKEREMYCMKCVVCISKLLDYNNRSWIEINCFTKKNFPCLIHVNLTTTYWFLSIRYCTICLSFLFIRDSWRPICCWISFFRCSAKKTSRKKLICKIWRKYINICASWAAETFNLYQCARVLTMFKSH